VYVWEIERICMNVDVGMEIDRGVINIDIIMLVVVDYKQKKIRKKDKKK